MNFCWVVYGVISGRSCSEEIGGGLEGVYYQFHLLLPGLTDFIG